VLGAVMQRASSPEYERQVIEAVADVDVTEFLSRVTMPVLVLHSRAFTVPSYEHVQDIPAALPDARLVTLARTEFMPFAGDADSVVCAIRRFLDEA